MSRTFLAWAAVCGLLVACTDPQPQRRLTEAQMAAVLRDMTVVEAELQHAQVMQGGLQSARDRIGARLYGQIVARNGVDTAAVNETLRYYEQHPKEYQALVQQVLDTLGVQTNAARARTYTAPQPDAPRGSRRPSRIDSLNRRQQATPLSE